MRERVDGWMRIRVDVYMGYKLKTKNLKFLTAFLIAARLRSTGADNCGQDHMAFAGSDLLPARPQSRMRQRVKVILPVRAGCLIGGRCRRLSKAYMSANVCARLWLILQF